MVGGLVGGGLVVSNDIYIHNRIVTAYIYICTGFGVLLQMVRLLEQTPSQANYDSDSMHFNLWKKTENNGIAKPKTLSHGWVSLI